MSDTPTNLSLLPAAVLLATAVGATCGVLLMGESLAPSPPLAPPSEVASWADGRDPLDVAAGTARLVVLAVAVYVGFLGVTNLVAALTGSRTARSIATRVTPRVMAVALAGSVAGLGPVGAEPADRTAPPGPGRGARMELVDADDGPRTWLPRGGSSATTTTTTSTAPSTTATARTPTTTGPTTTAAALQPTATPPVPPPPLHIDLGGDPAAHTLERHHVVRPGEHLWSIAADVVERHHGHRPARAHVRYWLTLVAVNRDRFVDPTNPSLVHAGLELVLPDPADAGG